MAFEFRLNSSAHRVMLKASKALIDKSEARIEKNDQRTGSMAWPVLSPSAFDKVILIRLNLRAFAINTENAPEGQAVRTHPFLREFAGQALADCSHPSPIVIVGNG